MNIIQPDYSKYTDGLVPAIIQDSRTRVVLMCGMMNAEALSATQSSGNVTFYSRSKKRLWMKGEESGNILQVVSIDLDCDNDVLLIQVVPIGPVCHTGTDTCWGKENVRPFLSHLEATIQSRKTDASSGSYTAELFAKGINKVAQKVGEEAVEVVIEAMGSDDDLFLNESADLFYHYLVLLAAKGYQLSDVEKVLQSRHTKR
jgi:phosphoribosyl-ATP pyrophosphohydrolase/phosphoribosyl-AMP cyclohydrolase